MCQLFFIPHFFPSSFFLLIPRNLTFSTFKRCRLHHTSITFYHKALQLLSLASNRPCSIFIPANPSFTVQPVAVCFVPALFCVFELWKAEIFFSWIGSVEFEFVGGAVFFVFLLFFDFSVLFLEDFESRFWFGHRVRLFGCRLLFWSVRVEVGNALRFCVKRDKINVDTGCIVTYCALC